MVSEVIYIRINNTQARAKTGMLAGTPINFMETMTDREKLGSARLPCLAKG